MESVNKIIRVIDRFKILHIAFWIWHFVSTIHVRQEFQGGSTRSHLSNAITLTIWEMICVYTIIYLIYPREIKKDRILRFFLMSFVWIALCAFLNVMSHKVYLLLAVGKTIVTSNLLIYSITALTDMLVISGIFIAITVIGSVYRKDQQNKKLREERLEAELSFLKSQTSPHFLFNALNSIYVLIELDKTKARDVLLKFSGLLRYQLYECNNLVFLSKEMEFLDHYIGLEKVRTKNLEVIYEKPEEIPNFEIAPFLLIPLVENAFKYVSANDQGKKIIRIKLAATDGTLQAEIWNTLDGVIIKEDTATGIGLQNVKRRLDLLYPGRHSLEIQKGNQEFTVNLSLYADQNELHHH